MGQKPRTPSYRRQKQKRRSDQAFVVLNGKRHYLGPYGSPQSKAAYQKIVAEWLVGGGELPPEADDLTVMELLARYWKWAEKHYRDAKGNPTTSIDNARQAVRRLRDGFGSMSVADFRPRAYKAFRQELVDEGHSRPYVNRLAGIVKRIFKWGVAEELVPSEVYHELAAVPGLQRGRTDAPECEPIKPVPDAYVDAVLDHLTPTVRAMVELQQCTGMRPAEVCTLRPADINTGSDVWTATPVHHKTAYRDRSRTVFIGPKGQEILQPFLATDRPLDKPIFSPKRSEAEALERRHSERKTPLSCGNRPGSNRTDDPKRSPGEEYTTATYRRAIHRACDRAGVPKWSPNRLRHNYATMVRRDHGLEAAQVLLGHAKADVTQVYAEVDQRKAMQVAALVG